MIPISLTIEGVYSYKNRTTIDFEELCSDHLFGIFGAVGSGKSTLLEAITYALYGQTERMNHLDKVSANMMNLSSDEMYIEFSFLAQNQQWIAVRQVRRKGRQKQDIETLTPSFYKVSDFGKMPATAEEMQKAIGLTYENFRRVIIIPQGKFQEFLQLGDKERSGMMKELFPELRKFDLSDKTNALLSQVNSRIDLLNGIILSTGEVSGEEIVMKETVLKQIESQQELCKKQEEDLQKQDSFQEQLKGYFQKLEEETKKLAELEAKNPQVAEYEKATEEYDFCVNIFKTELSDFDRASGEAEKIQQSVAQCKEAKQAAIAKQQQIADEVNKIAPLYNERQKITDKALDCRKIIEILAAEKEWNLLQLKLKEQEREKTLQAEKLQFLQNELKTVEDESIKLKFQLLDEEMLNNIEKWFSKDKLLGTNKIEAERNLTKQQQELNKSEQNLARLKEEEMFKNFSEEKETLFAFIENLQQHCEQKKAEKENELRIVLVQKEFGKHALTLKSGEACPLCGATEHPSIILPENNDALLAKLTNEKTAIETHQRTLQHTLVELNKIEINRQNAVKNTENAAERLQEAISQQLSYKTNFPVSSFSPEKEEDFRQAFEGNLALKTTILAKENLKLETGKKITEIDQQIREKELVINELKNRISVLEGAIGIQKKALILLPFLEYNHFPVNQLEEMAEKWMSQQKEIENRYEKLIHQREECSNDLAKLDGILQTENARFETTIITIAQQQVLLSQKLSDSAFQNLNDIRQILAKAMDTRKIREHITAHREKLHAARQNYVKICEQIGDNKYDTSRHEETKTALLSIKKQLQNHNEETGKLKTELIALKSSLEKQKSLKVDLKQQEIRKSNLTKLQQMFRGNGFIKFVSTLYLQEICKAANERFTRMTQNRLHLELNENANFVIRDFLNEGKTRNVKTLSGGQTFQAALALALAMVDNLKFGEKTKSFFFLDEGFGSQDRDSLRIVFDTLQNLRNENHIVGLISHVEEMKEEMSRYLTITNTDDEGSKIEMSWK